MLLVVEVNRPLSFGAAATTIAQNNDENRGISYIGVGDIAFGANLHWTRSFSIFGTPVAYMEGAHAVTRP